MTDEVSHWGDLEKTPKSKNNAFNTNYVIGRINTRAMQFHADAKARTSKVVERMRASGIEPAKLNISSKGKRK